jgi:hypothetical protein
VVLHSFCSLPPFLVCEYCGTACTLFLSLRKVYSPCRCRCISCLARAHPPLNGTLPRKRLYACAIELISFGDISPVKTFANVALDRPKTPRSRRRLLMVENRLDNYIEVPIYQEGLKMNREKTRDRTVYMKGGRNVVNEPKKKGIE